MRYYAIADLHGRFDLLEKARLAIKEDTRDLAEGDFKVITLGDYIDRGPQSKEVIESLMESQRLFPYMVCLQGNHEAIAVETITVPLHYEWWMSNGGYSTIKSYNPDAYYGEIGWMNQEHVRWIGSLPLHYETEHHIFVHAGIPYSNLPINKQDPEKMQWMLYGPEDHGGWNGKHVVHGHHQFEDGPHEWTGRTDLDTFAWKSGRLVIGVYSSDKLGHAVKYIEVLGDDYKKGSPSKE
jgi:serine/threonine protein phosphatase 1